MSGYHLFVGLAVAVLFAVQHMVECRLTGASRAVMGYVISVRLFAAVAEFATLALGRRLAKLSGESSDEGDRVPVAGIFAIASLLLLLNLFSKTLSDHLAIQRLPPPTIPLLVLVGLWLAVLWRVHRQGCSPRTCHVALAGLVLGTRVLVLWVSPFNRLAGDVLASIDRSLDNLLAGHFPYVNFPPPRPYLPGVLLLQQKKFARASRCLLGNKAPLGGWLRLAPRASGNRRRKLLAYRDLRTRRITSAVEVDGLPATVDIPRLVSDIAIRAGPARGRIGDPNHDGYLEHGG